jgi:predicted P-loop ATPase
MTEAQRIAAKHAEIAARYKAKRRKRPPVSMAALRVAELRRFFHDCYGPDLPDDDAGRADARLMAHHLAHRIGDPSNRIAAWLEGAAPWMAPDERADLAANVIAKPLRYRADKLAAMLGLTEATRRRLRITTIGAIDCTKAERLEQRRERARLAKQAKRRAAGNKTRAAYLEDCKAKSTRPWQAAGISRSRWYRMGRPASSPRQPARVATA